MTAGQAICRMVKSVRRTDAPKDYRESYALVDERTAQILASCDLMGHATFSPVSLIDHDQRIWTMRPNRRIMPSRWIVTDPDQSIAVQFDQNISRKILNPIYRNILTLYDGEGKETCRIADPRTSTPDRILGVGPDGWLVLRGDKAVAEVVRLPGNEGEATGLLGRVRRFFTSRDIGIISQGSSHFLPAPPALAMLLLISELTGSRNGGAT